MSFRKKRLKSERRNFSLAERSLVSKMFLISFLIFQCSMCEKSFMSDYFLQNHIQRRHPDYVTNVYHSQHQMHGNQSSSLTQSKVMDLEKEITHLKERLNSTELSLEKATRSESFMKVKLNTNTECLLILDEPKTGTHFQNHNY